ncbi:MAG: GTPase HflX [Fibromonadaceae bacterium]|jgi:GTP-binding protein HflX|nr:GTPase HflX [Fibromonadaceae bacterium]
MRFLFSTLYLLNTNERYILEKAVLVGVVTPKVRVSQAQEYLQELQRLAETAGAEVAEVFLQRVQALNPATLIGTGKIEEVKLALENHDAGMVIFDEDLSGSQIRNLEKRLPKIKVLDRTGLILDIFAKHARTAESRLMVEVAQMQYVMPRLTRAWVHLSRQASGEGPGIGMRGPGETQLEVDRRLIRKRIQELKAKLKKIERDRALQEKHRENIFHVGVVGYTNAGKSTLTNRLTKAGLYVEDKLFATLDSTTRKFHLAEGQNIILSDTVGFIRKLPHHLVETFKSTLGVATNADCILEIIDSAASDYKEHIEVTNKILSDLVHCSVPRFRVFNKTDVANATRIEELSTDYPDAIQISALENTGMEKLKNRLMKELAKWTFHRTQKVAEEKMSSQNFLP